VTDSLGAAPAGHVRLNIGEVLDQLRPDFPGVTIPKIRFLEDKGLIKPERTPSGYRKFSLTDIDRLRYILRMQRDHYLPLRVIGQHLDAIDRGMEPPPIEPVVPTVPTVALAADGTPAPESFTRRDNLRLSRKELVKIAEVPDELLTQLEQFGLITPRTGTGHYDTDALVIAIGPTRLSASDTVPAARSAIGSIGPDTLGNMASTFTDPDRLPARSGRPESTAGSKPLKSPFAFTASAPLCSCVSNASRRT